jgi:hypothetical protein
MIKSNRKSGRLLAWALLVTLLSSSLLTVQARPPLPEEIETHPIIPLAPSAPPAPTQVSPPHGTHTTGNPNDTTPGRVLYEPLGMPCFEWEPTSGADEYQLQVSETEQDAGVVLDIGGGFSDRMEQTMYCLTASDMIASKHGVQDETQYYWRVRAKGGSPALWGPWSGWWNFTRHWGDVPTLLEPASEAILVQPPVLSWTPVDGAAFYELEVSSDANFPDVGALDWPAFTWRLSPQNTEYSMGTKNTGSEKNYLPNDPTIYWRVRAVSYGNVDTDYRVGDWSNGGEGQVFNLCWACDMTGTSIGFDYRPQHLTPARETLHVNSAYFSWTPVQGAAWYDLEVNDTYSFEQDPTGHILTNGRPFSAYNTGLLWEIDKKWYYYSYVTNRFYWRVRAVNYYGVESEWTSEKNDVSSGFEPEHVNVSPIWRFNPVVPDLLYPLFYYEPLYDDELWEDRTINTPLFMWDKVPGAISYTLEVASDNIFQNVAWSQKTWSLSASPTSTLPFETAGLYYWHVKAHPQNVWSQRWETYIDQSIQILTPTVTSLRPLYPSYREQGDGYTYGQEVLGRFPRLEWFPVAGADHYEVQFATEDSFASPLESVETELTSYTPVAYYPPDTYFWRARAEESDGTPIGTGEGWSSTARFVQARQYALKWVYDVDPFATNPWREDFTTDSLLAVDPAGDQSGSTDEQYDLTSLYTALDNNFWYFGWDVYTETNDPPVTFQLYLDTDGADGRGMSTNPDGGALPNDDEPYRPEYVLEWAMASPDEAIRYRNLGGAWNGEFLTSLGGHARLTTTVLYTGSVAAILAVPHDVLGNPATINALLVAIDADNNVMDTMDLGYVTVSSAPLPRPLPHDRYDADGMPHYYAETPLLTWYSIPNVNRNAGLETSTSYGFSADSRMEMGAAPDAGTLNLMSFTSSNPYFRSHLPYSDNVYYWRTRSRYPDLEFGEEKDYGWDMTPTYDKEASWSRPASFSKETPVPTNLTISDAVLSGTLPYVDKTPTFSWDPVQGAGAYYFELVGAAYDLTVIGTASTSYVPTQIIPNGEYEWHVGVVDGKGNYNQDAYATARFVKGSDTPTPVFPLGSDTFTDTVYFEWEPLAGAGYYELEIAADPYYSSLYDDYDRINNTIFVPGQIPEAVEWGNFYWRVCGFNGAATYSGYSMGCEEYYMEIYTDFLYLPVVIND